MKQTTYRTIVISGASGAIGRSCLERFAPDCETVIALVHRHAEALDGPAQELPCQLEIIRCDLSDPAATAAILNTTLGSRPIDLLVHAAGIAHLGQIQDLSLTDWLSLLHTNLTSAILLSQAVIPSMITARSGRLLFISSVWGQSGASCEAAYSATKGGLDSFTKALAKELAPAGISVNAVSPGLVDTPMNAGLSDEELNALCAEIPIGRAASSAEIADCIYRVCKLPTYLTGQIIRIDGGWL
ncbi:MAG: SDR family NAD(P)-dependent oxidoreductase [Lachnospiraceae bacterium]|nr:SDR family NAD(P)-dependent oxidoreductase [Lachnospiraceae bacterium]MDY5741425.1 SDR family NAD(P)-dependent oxidoreductase [Lachnospiraceae bacterium]